MLGIRDAIVEERAAQLVHFQDVFVRQFHGVASWFVTQSNNSFRSRFRAR